MQVLDLHYKLLYQDFHVQVDIHEYIYLVDEQDYYHNYLMYKQIFVANIHETKHFLYCYEHVIDENIVQNRVHVMNVL